MMKRFALCVLCVLALTSGLWPLASASQRIVSLVPAATEMLFAIGAGDRLVGVSSFDTYPPQVKTLPRVGGLLDPDLERVLALRPDLVITYGSQQDLRVQLRRAKIDTFAYTHGSLADIMLTMKALGQRLGLATQADAAARTLHAQLARVSDRVAGRPRPRTMLVFGRERGALRGIYASGGRGFLHDALEAAGGDDVFKDIDRESVQVTSELALARAPEVIIELHPDVQLDEAAIARERQVWRPLASIPAVRNGRIYLLTGPELVLAGPRIGDVTERFARVLHPGAHAALMRRLPSPDEDFRVGPARRRSDRATPPNASGVR